MTEQIEDVGRRVGVGEAELEREFLSAATALDTGEIRALLDQVLDRYDLDTAVVDVLVPLLHRVGTLWEEGCLSVLAEHAISSVIRSVVAELGTLPETERAHGTIVLACPPGELHDLPTHLFAAMLRGRGCRTVVLGANVPWPVLSRATRIHRADAIVIGSMRPHSLTARSTGLAHMTRHLTVYIAGPAARQVSLPGVTNLPDDWRAALAVVTGTA